MKYWERWIGDWKRKTAHLNAEAKGIYAELLDHMYANEAALPTEPEELYRVAGARSSSECRTTDRIVKEFFQRTDDGYVNPRALEEIHKRTKYVQEQKARAERRWSKEPTEPAAAPKPRGNGTLVPCPDWLDSTLFSQWLHTRPARARTEPAQRAALEKLEAMRAKGLDPNQVVRDSLANGWQGLFEPDKPRGQRPSLAEANRAAAAEATRRFEEEHGIK